MEPNLRNTKSSPKKSSKQSSSVEDVQSEKEIQPGKEQKPPKNIKRQQPSASDEPENLKSRVCDDRAKEIESVISDEDDSQRFMMRFQLDGASVVLFLLSFVTRFYKITHPKGVVFDEIHYGRFASLYLRNTFYFDQHPPLGKMLIAGVASAVGYSGKFEFPKIGSEYDASVPIFAFRFVPALCGSLLAPVIYSILRQIKLSQRVCVIGGLLVVFDNALLTHSRFVLMEPMLLLFSSVGILFVLKFLASVPFSTRWWSFGALAAAFLTAAVLVKYIGFYSYLLACYIIGRHVWMQLPDRTQSNLYLVVKSILKATLFVTVSLALYVGCFYVHLDSLYKAGPHDSVMTSAFQASLEGGLASITKGQPLRIQHGSQITLKHTHGRVCWLHSHAHVYPIKYADGRGSSHQQQVTCYGFKDVNNWWIVKRPEKENIAVEEEPDYIENGDIIQLVHGVTSRALNSHDVASPMSPLTQEVSCYIDYNISMPANLLWRVDIINPKDSKNRWNAITSQVRLVHVDTSAALKFTAEQLPDWGFNQFEVAADKRQFTIDTIWNVEEHRYTQDKDKKDVLEKLLKTEMIPTAPTKLSFWEKFSELQMKMLLHAEKLEGHMYSSEPFEWPFMDKGIAYWVDNTSNAQIFLLGNLVIWYSASLALVAYVGLLAFYLIRRRRRLFDLDEEEWKRFRCGGEIFLVGYFTHYLPYFFVERTLFLYNYLPALLYKILLLCFVLEHIQLVLRKFVKVRLVSMIFNVILVAWLSGIFYFYSKYSVLCYGTTELSADDVLKMRLKDTWDLIVHKA
ncbi:protein O-mannosyltransferase 1 [Toxorhynchites rutilus septentrionalis]|uniref:protein O-mannosyltransferase 1 n=1 Tax=Toxorhynchites rutilus septentrionalis TaxID=329112 RepID=UPI00247916AC|nr:protein O-mannosyltransferase 1 [Toxorhynchites rutilus septentrionalis]